MTTTRNQTEHWLTPQRTEALASQRCTPSEADSESGSESIGVTTIRPETTLEGVFSAAKAVLGFVGSRPPD